MRLIKRLMATNYYNRGDTIIEVLMSIAIVGAVIAGAYALASRSLAEGISASEHSTAIKMAETQVETLKSRQKDALNGQAIWDSNYGAVALASNNINFCMDPTAISMLDASGNPTANWIAQKNGGIGFTGNNLQVGTGSDEYNAVCTRDVNGAVGTVNTAKYFINVKLIATPNLPNYLVTVRWTPAGNGPTSQSQIYYRF
jgi:type II secretory pathway pseudopilin PulG